MEPLESYRLTLQNLLGAALREHHCARQWHYAIDMEDTHQDSLSSYLRLNHKQLRSLLLASGLAGLHGQQFRINRNQGHSSYSWQQFLVEQSLEGCYFDSFSIKKKRQFWIGLGSLKNKVLAGPFNPATQSTFYKTPPRLPKSNTALLRKSRSMMVAVLDIYNQEMEKNMQADEEEDEDNLDRTLHSSAGGDDGEKEMDENLRNLALALLEQISKDESTDPVECIVGLLKTIRASQNAKQKARLSLVSDDNMEEHQEEEFETRESSFPSLSQIGLPVTKRLVSSLLREIVDPWFGGSLDSPDGAMEWYWRLP